MTELFVILQNKMSGKFMKFYEEASKSQSFDYIKKGYVLRINY